VIGRQRLRRSGEGSFWISPCPDVPTVRRAREGACIGGYVFGHDGAREPMKIEMALLAAGVIGAPRRVGDHIAFVLDHIRRAIEDEAIAGELASGFEQPVVALRAIAALQINY